MYPILKAEKLAEKIYLMVVKAPRVAKNCQPGEFIIVKIDEVGERIPLTICDYNREEGTVTIVFQIVGGSTERMADLKAGDAFHDFVGPLGNPSEFVHEDIESLKNKKMLFVAGGVGTAPVYPQVKWLHEHGVDVDVIMGSRTKELLFYIDEMKAVSKNSFSSLRIQQSTAVIFTVSLCFTSFLLRFARLTEFSGLDFSIATPKV